MFTCAGRPSGESLSAIFANTLNSSVSVETLLVVSAAVLCRSVSTLVHVFAVCCQPWVLLASGTLEAASDVDTVSQTRCSYSVDVLAFVDICMYKYKFLRFRCNSLSLNFSVVFNISLLIFIKFQ